MILHGLEIRPCPGCEVELPVNPLNILVFARRLRQVRTRRCERGNIQRCCSSHFGHALRIRKTSGKIGMRVLLVMLMCPVFPAGILGSSPGLLMHPGAVTGGGHHPTSPQPGAADLRAEGEPTIWTGDTPAGRSVRLPPSCSTRSSVLMETSQPPTFCSTIWARFSDRDSAPANTVFSTSPGVSSRESSTRRRGKKFLRQRG